MLLLRFLHVTVAIFPFSDVDSEAMANT